MRLTVNLFRTITVSLSYSMSKRRAATTNKRIKEGSASDSRELSKKKIDSSMQLIETDQISLRIWIQQVSKISLDFRTRLLNLSRKSKGKRLRCVP